MSWLSTLHRYGKYGVTKVKCPKPDTADKELAVIKLAQNNRKEAVTMELAGDLPFWGFF